MFCQNSMFLRGPIHWGLIRGGGGGGGISIHSGIVYYKSCILIGYSTSVYSMLTIRS